LTRATFAQKSYGSGTKLHKAFIYSLNLSSLQRGKSMFTVLNPRAENMAGADGPIHNWSGPLPATGDYIIEVLNSGTGLANFALTVTIR